MTFAAAGQGATFMGPAGVLVSLGVETIVTNPILVQQIYNYCALIPLFILAISASQRDARFVGILIPIWGGISMFFGWLQAPDVSGPGSGTATSFALLVVLTMLGIMMYMQETVHERFGIAGPGNKVIKIFVFMIILQCGVVFLNSSAIFPPTTQPITVTDQQYTNIKLSDEVAHVSGSGGIFAGIVDIVSLGAQIAYSSLLLLLKLLTAIGFFAYVLAQVFPWIVQAGTIGLAFLVVLQFAIWTMYLIFIFTLFYKPGPDPGW